MLTGGSLTSRHNQLIFDIAGQKPYFRGETVSFTATSGNTTTGSVAITPFIGSFRVVGLVPAANGTFAARTNFGMGNLPVSIALGDMNGDGRLDIVSAGEEASVGSANSVCVQLGDGTGSFGPVALFAASSLSSRIVLGDLNGDGRLDVVTANAASNNASVRLGQ